MVERYTPIFQVGTLTLKRCNGVNGFEYATQVCLFLHHATLCFLNVRHITSLRCSFIISKTKPLFTDWLIKLSKILNVYKH